MVQIAADPSRNWRGPDWFEPRLPSSAECSLGILLASRAAAAPGAPVMIYEDGTKISNAQLHGRALALAAQLQAKGVTRGDIVGLWQPNGINMLASIVACAMLGAVAGQINIAFRGAMLEHALRITGAKILVAHGELVERLTAIDRVSLECVISTDVPAKIELGMPIEDINTHAKAGLDLPLQELNAWDLAAIIFTSGTTGPSKGVRVTCCQLWSLGKSFYGYMSPSDRMLLALPMFHIASLGALWGAMSSGAVLVVMESIRADTFWQVVRRCGVTTTMGFSPAFAEMLLKSPPDAGDRDHDMRLSLFMYVNAAVRAFAERFGVAVFSGFSMSETSVVTITQINPAKNNCIGRPRKGIEIRVVDEHDIEVPVGQLGELVLRSAIPWVLNDGYQNAAEPTAQAWRNGWFHTGDLVVADEDGDLFYRDRLKDAIRRRGENISSIEVEAEIRALPDVAEVAAIGVKAIDGEEILVVVCPIKGGTIDPGALIATLVARMPHYMVPRYVRIIDELPVTQTTKVMKNKLREAGITADTWDREAAGIRVTRKKLTRSDASG